MGRASAWSALSVHSMQCQSHSQPCQACIITLCLQDLVTMDEPAMRDTLGIKAFGKRRRLFLALTKAFNLARTPCAEPLLLCASPPPAPAADAPPAEIPAGAGDRAAEDAQMEAAAASPAAAAPSEHQMQEASTGQAGMAQVKQEPAGAAGAAGAGAGAQQGAGDEPMVVDLLDDDDEEEDGDKGAGKKAQATMQPDADMLDVQVVEPASGAADGQGGKAEPGTGAGAAAAAQAGAGAGGASKQRRRKGGAGAEEDAGEREVQRQLEAEGSCVGACKWCVNKVSGGLLGTGKVLIMP